jgi:hypothetical protein
VDGGKKMTNAADHTTTIDLKPPRYAALLVRQMKKEDFRDKWIAAAP